MKRIIIHWTAGVYQPNTHEFESYHYLINGDGLVIKGKYTPEDNLNCSDGLYARHTGGGNTGAIGIALCGMFGFINRKSVGKFPLTKIQCERCFKLIAELSKKYNIDITPSTVLTHYEFGKTHPKSSSAGKIDIVYLAPYPDIPQDEIGDCFRKKAKWYYTKIL